MGLGAVEGAVLEFIVSTDEAEQKLDEFKKSFDSFDSLVEKQRQTFERLTQGIQQYLAMAERGDRVADIMQANKVSTEEAAAAVGGMVSNVNLAIIANRAHQAGLDLTATQLRALVVAGKQYADATGGDAMEATERLTQAVVRGSERGLKPFGIHAKTAADAIAELSEKFGHASVAAEGVGDNLEALTTSWTNLVDKIAMSVNESGPVSDLLKNMTSLVTLLGSSQGGVDALGNAFTLFTLGPLAATNEALDRTLEKLRQVTAAQSGENDTLQWFDDADDPSTWGGLGGRRAGTVGTRIRFSSAPAELTPGATRTGIHTRPPGRGRRGGGGGGGGALSPEDAADHARGLMLAAEEERARVAEHANADWEKHLDELAQTEEQATVRRLTAQKRAHEHEIEEERRHNDKVIDLAREKAKREEEVHKAELAAQQQYFQEAANLVVQGSGILGASEATQNVIRGLTEEVLVATSIAAMNYPGAVAHQVAATLAFATAAKQGGKGASSSGRSAGAAGAGVARSPSALGGGGFSHAGGNVINITAVIDTAGTGYVPEETRRKFGRMMSQVSRDGFFNEKAA